MDPVSCRMNVADDGEQNETGEGRAAVLPRPAVDHDPQAVG